ncbi:MAG: penicillin acylase family protein [Chloroflexi bacterium]|nr:penicillin acylase family protein [Chloroflexota bacterium]
MKHWQKIVAIILIVLLVLPVVVLAWGYFSVVKPALPQLNGEMTLDGLTAPVTVYRDNSGIPHIVAVNEHDLFFAQGFVHAQDRLWAMESTRRAAHGTLSEVIGDRGLNNDRMMRILGMTESAEADWETLDAETQSALQAYADGVNAYLDQAGGRLPLEFKILGITPQAWTPIDSLVFGKLIAWGLSNNYQDELIVTKLAAQTSWENVLDIMPEYDGPTVIPDANLTASLSETASAMLEINTSWGTQVPLSKPDQGSNAWVVGGSHTASGAPLLASDPHQGLLMPTLWYEVGLHTSDGKYDVVGGSLPGLPGIEIGHNARIAWGVTNARPDVEDLFIETLNDSGTQYQFMDEWKDLTFREETIHVKDAEPVVLKVRITHHGPLVSDILESSEQHMALRWTGLDGRPLARAILRLNQAQNWDEFRVALQDWQLPSMNFVYADVDGNIGFQMPGAVPVRAGNDVYGLHPVSGADGAHEWVDFVPYDELPSAFNPSGDFFASANNKPYGDDYPHFLSHYYQPPYRVALITETIRDSHGITADDFAALQGSWYSGINQQVAKTLAAEAQAGDEQQTAILQDLNDWDGFMTPDSRAAALTESAIRNILRLTLTPKLGADTAEIYLTLGGYPYMYLQKILDDPASSWWGGDRAGILTAALTASMDELSASLGDDPSKWTWGDLHQMNFSHPLGSVAILKPIFSRGPYPTGGNWNTVDSGAYYPDKAYGMVLGPAYRIISDPADWDQSRSIIPSGESGQPFSPYYDDQIAPWLAVEYHPLPFSLPAIESSAEHTLILNPAP